MQIDIRARNIDLSADVRMLAERRALFALGRFAARIRSVSIVVTDINGPRGGVDTQCRVRITGRDGWSSTITDTDHDAARAVTFAIGRAGHVVSRQAGRQREITGATRRNRRAS